jgi:hypothetical protein
MPDVSVMGERAIPTGMDTRPEPKEGGWSAPLDDRFYSDSLAMRLMARTVLRDILEWDTPGPNCVRDERKLVEAVECILVNFLRLRCSGAGELGIPLHNGSKRFRYGRVKYTAMRRAVEGMRAARLIALAKPAKNHLDPKLRRTGRYAATPPLLAMFDKYGLSPADVKTRERKKLAELRSPKAGDLERGKEKHWPRGRNDVRKDARENLWKINRALADACIALHVPDSVLEEIQRQHARSDQGKYVDFFNRDLYRVYNETPDQGGRFYGGWWINIPGKYRKHIHISAPGKHPAYTAELDYSAIQPRILYSKESPGYAGDPYRIYESDAWNDALRPVIKILFLQMLNCNSRKQAVKAANREIYAEHSDAWLAENPGFYPPPELSIEGILERRFWHDCPTVSQIMDQIEEAHPKIAKHFYSGIGLELMNKDAKLAEAVMLRVIDELGTVALPIHDSFLIRHDYKDALWSIMEQESKRLFGDTFHIKPDAPEYDPADHMHLEPEPRDPADDRELLRQIGDDLDREEQRYSRYRGWVDAWAAALPADERSKVKMEVVGDTTVMRQLIARRSKHLSAA